MYNDSLRIQYLATVLATQGRRLSSQAKIAANRKNACNSTGPKTERGKANSRLNALKYGIYATTPVLPAEDEDAYRELEKLNQEYFAPVGPVENLLVRQINIEQWKLKRIETAEIAFLEQLREESFAKFLRALDLNEIIYALSVLTQESPEELVQQGRESLASKMTSPPTQSKERNAENAANLPEDKKRDIEAKMLQLSKLDNTLLDAVIPHAEAAPQACLDRERRTTVRAYLAYVDKLKELQESRSTVTLAVQPVTKMAKLRTARPANTSVPGKDVSQNQSRAGISSHATAAPFPTPKAH